MEKGISQNQHIGSQNTNSKNNLPFVCLSVYWPKNKLQSRKLLLCTNYNELTLHGKIHKTTDKSESTCYLTHVLYSIQDQRAAREWNMRARCQLEHAGLWYNRTSSSFVQRTRNMKASILIFSGKRSFYILHPRAHIYLPPSLPSSLPSGLLRPQATAYEQICSLCSLPYLLPLMSKYIVSAHSLNKLHLAPYE